MGGDSRSGGGLGVVGVRVDGVKWLVGVYGWWESRGSGIKGW